MDNHISHNGILNLTSKMLKNHHIKHHFDHGLNIHQFNEKHCEMELH